MSNILKAFPFSVAEEKNMTQFILCLVLNILLCATAVALICLVQVVGALAVVMGSLLAVYSLAGLVITLLAWFNIIH